MLISNKGKKFLTGRWISYLCCLWAWPGSNIFKNFFNKKFLDLSLEYPFNSAGHSDNIDFFLSLSNFYPRVYLINALIEFQRQMWAIVVYIESDIFPIVSSNTILYVNAHLPQWRHQRKIWQYLNKDPKQGSPPTLEFWRNIFRIMGLGLFLSKFSAGQLRSLRRNKNGQWSWIKVIINKIAKNAKTIAKTILGP